MDIYKRHQRTWKWLYALLHRYVERKFNLSHENLCPEGPCIIVPNHVSEWDPLLVAMSFPEKQMYFVASEHLFRKGFVTKLLNYLVAPIARKKATMGTDTVKACLRHLKDGHSICLFAEGDATWDGLSMKVFPSTGKLVRSSGASLVTYRLEGGYLSDPRWGKGVRRGKMHGGPVRVYSPEELKAMTPQEITAAINRDIYEDAWERQKNEKVSFKCKAPARFIERALFLCPGCRKMGGLKGEGSKLRCKCGLELNYLDTGFFDPPRPFENMAQWDAWQFEQLKTGDYEHGEELFFDEDVKLSRVLTGHREKPVCIGKLSQYEERLCCADRSFRLSEINQMAMVQANVLLLNCGEEYFQLRSEKTACLRKYLAMWENQAAK